MTIKKRKKAVRMRGSKTHGGGAMKKRRGAGSRGGRGRAGQGKRACQKMPSAYARKDFLGKQGFIRHGLKKNIKGVNFDFFNENIEKLLSEKKIEKKGDTYLIDLEKLGYTKLLGSGKVNFKMQIKALVVSKKAEEKIKEAGGEIVKTGVQEAQE